MRWWDGATWGPPPVGAPIPGRATFAGRGRPTIAGWRRNLRSLAALFVGAVCLGFAISTHIIYVGLIAVAVSLRAAQRREPWAVAAIAATAAMTVAGVALSAAS